MTQLSNVPLNHLLTTPGWLTGKHGGAGTITAIHSKQSGIYFEIYLEIEWDTGNKSFPVWPTECVNITVNEEWQPKMCHEFVEAQVALLDQHINYNVRHTDTERMARMAQESSTNEKDTGEHNNVQEDSAKVSS